MVLDDIDFKINSILHSILPSRSVMSLAIVTLQRPVASSLVYFPDACFVRFAN